MEAFDIFSQGSDLESCGDLSEEDLLDKPDYLSDRESEALLVVPDVTDVLLWSLSFVMVSLVALIGTLWNRSLFLVPRSVHFGFQVRRKR